MYNITYFGRATALKCWSAIEYNFFLSLLYLVYSNQAATTVFFSLLATWALAIRVFGPSFISSQCSQRRSHTTQQWQTLCKQRNDHCIISLAQYLPYSLHVCVLYSLLTKQFVEQNSTQIIHSYLSDVKLLSKMVIGSLPALHAYIHLETVKHLWFEWQTVVLSSYFFMVGFMMLHGYIWSTQLSTNLVIFLEAE